MTNLGVYHLVKEPLSPSNPSRHFRWPRSPMVVVNVDYTTGKVTILDRASAEEVLSR